MGEPVKKVEERFTYKDLKTWPEGERWELIKGLPFQMSSPQIIHQRVLLSLTLQLAEWLKGKKCELLMSPVDVLFRDQPGQEEDEVDTVLIPDLTVVCDPEKIHTNGIHGGPDWVLEVLSPSTSWRDLTEKREIYERHGVKEYWVLNPETLDVTLYRRQGDRFASPAGANLREPVAVDLFPGLILRLA